MTAPLNIDPTAQATATGYSDRPVTKPPNWHGLVTLDLLLNNLSSGLFLVAALGELVVPESFKSLAALAYPIALLFLIGDLVCLVLDLGDPFRFHHMLRVWKPSSPMSLGTWCLAAYAVLLTAVTVMGLVPASAGLEWARRLTLVVGLVLAVGAAAYKGVLFSTTAQRGWGDARWLGGYLVNSALVLGSAELLLLAMAARQPEAAIVLRLALRLLLPLNLLVLGLLLADLRGPLSAARGFRALAVIGMLAIVGGILVPLWLLALDAPPATAGALLLILLGAVVVRSEIVRLPHLLATANPGMGHSVP